MTLPLALRNRLAELILEGLGDREARHTLEALGAFCRSPDGRVGPDAVERLRALGWFQPAANSSLRLLGSHQDHRVALCRRAEAALTMFREGTALPDAGTRPGLLARAALLADRGLFFEVHELLEPAWMRAEGAERVALQGFIQVAVALHHAQSGNRAGAISLLTEGLTKLGSSHAALPLDIRAWKAGMVTILAELKEGRAMSTAPRWPMSTETAWRSS